jgi:hypothetical protein
MFQHKLKQCGGAGDLSMPYRWYNPNATAFNPCNSSTKLKGGAGDLSMPYRWYHPEAPAFNPCGSKNMSSQRGGDEPMPYRNDALGGCGNNMSSQVGGNSFGAPFYIFTSGKDLEEHYPFGQHDKPAFVKVPANKFWYSKY